MRCSYREASPTSQRLGHDRHPLWGELEHGVPPGRRVSSPARLARDCRSRAGPDHHHGRSGPGRAPAAEASPTPRPPGPIPTRPRPSSQQQRPGRLLGRWRRSPPGPQPSSRAAAEPEAAGPSRARPVIAGSPGRRRQNPDSPSWPAVPLVIAAELAALENSMRGRPPMGFIQFFAGCRLWRSTPPDSGCGADHHHGEQRIQPCQTEINTFRSNV